MPVLANSAKAPGYGGEKRLQRQRSDPVYSRTRRICRFGDTLRFHTDRLSAPGFAGSPRVRRGERTREGGFAMTRASARFRLSLAVILCLVAMPSAARAEVPRVRVWDPCVLWDLFSGWIGAAPDRTDPSRMVPVVLPEGTVVDPFGRPAAVTPPGIPEPSSGEDQVDS